MSDNLSSRRREGIFNTAVGIRVAMYHWETVLQAAPAYSRQRTIAFAEHEKLRERLLGLRHRMLELRRGWTWQGANMAIEEYAKARWNRSKREKEGRT